MAEQVFVTLSESELRQKGDELAARIAELDELAEAKKDAMKDFSDRKEVLSAAIRKLSACIRYKGEYQDGQAALFSLPPQESSGKKGRRTDS